MKGDVAHKDNSEQLRNDLSGTVILDTKIQKPKSRKDYVIRQALIERLESNLQFPITLISANTGCGKSVSISQWLDHTQHRYGWLSLDEEHNNIEVLLAYLTTLLKQNWPAKDFGIAYITNAASLPVSVIATALIKDLNDIGEPFILVMDDYQLIREPRIHEIVEGILRYPPPHFHLVISTQIDPPIKLARLRAQFRLHELRMKDLVFTTEEALVLRTSISRSTTDDEVMDLLKYSEGWATGVIAGLMGLAEGIDIDKVTQALQNKGSVISELLDEVVLKGLPLKTVKYLELTAMLDRFSESLVKAMIEASHDEDLKQISSGELLKLSRTRNLFLIQLDSVGEWYRYHHFFKSQIATLIGKNFKTAVLEKLYRAASSWFEAKGFLEEALTYAMRSGDLDFAISLFSRFRHKLLNSEQLQRLYRLSRQFPDDVVNKNAELLINLAMLQHYNANFYKMLEYISKAETLLKTSVGIPNERQLWGEYHGVNTYLSYFKGDFGKAIEHGKKCMNLLPPDVPNFFREQSAGWCAFAQLACGNSRAGMDTLEGEYQALANTDSYFKIRLLQGKIIFNLFERNTTRLYQEGAALAKICSPNTYPGSWVIGIYGMTCRSYLNNELEKTDIFHDELRKYRFACRPFWVIHHFFIECLSGIAASSWNKVAHCLAECEELAEELAIETIKGIVKAFQVEYHLRRNDIDRAIQLSSLAGFEPQPPTFFYYIPQLTQVKLLFKTNQAERGEALLQDLLEIGRAHNNRNLLAQALALKASFYSENGRTHQAINFLKELLALEHSSRNIRTFLDQGPEMEKLVMEIEKTPANQNQVTNLLKAFSEEKASLHNQGTKAHRNSHTLPIHLSKRESQILALVTQGLKNEEIAEKLFVSPDTIKKHLYRTYQKLEVTNRIGAVQKAQALGLIRS